MSKKEGKAQMSSPDSSRPSLGHQMEEVSVTNKQKRKGVSSRRQKCCLTAKYLNGQMQMERVGISPQEIISLPSAQPNGKNLKKPDQKRGQGGHLAASRLPQNAALAPRVKIQNF